MKVKEKSKKAGLKLNIQKTKIMVSSLITSWQIDGETMEKSLRQLVSISHISEEDNDNVIPRFFKLW